jgi:glycolate oxidase iron-sulfur subunit
VSAYDATRPPQLELIDDCVHCGFCLPTCPTYSLWDEEMDSPRGRIVLIKSGLEEAAELSAPMIDALDNCLGCMACVTACPSGVQYDKLIEDARGQVERNWHRPLRERLLRRAIFALAPYPSRLRWLAPLTPLARFVPGRLGRLAPRRVAARRRLPERTPAAGSPRGRVGFVQGCVQRVFFGDVNEATIRVLSAEGFEVEVPPTHRCCGALQLHAGEAGAEEVARATIEAFEGFDYVVVNAAGCGSSMKDYAHLLREDPAWRPRAEAFSAKVRDVTELLGSIEPQAPRGPVPGKVAYHDACHLAHAQAVRAEPRELLSAIPELELVEPAEWEICCGSAGIYNLVKPEPAAELGRRKAQNLLDTGAELVAAANPGCVLQISAHARELGHDLPVVHPIELLDRSIAAGRG